MFSVADAASDASPLAVTVQLAVAIIGAGAAVGVAFASSRTQTRIAKAERAAAEERQERAVREEVMESLLDAILTHELEYEAVLFNTKRNHLNPEESRQHPDIDVLKRHLTRLTIRLGRRDLYLAIIAWLEAFTLSFPITRGHAALQLLHQRLDDWYLEEFTLEESLNRLRRDRDLFLQERFPTR